MKKWMIAVAICGILTAPVMASDFQEQAAVLNLLGIMEGDGQGNYEETQSLTRAQFCKMAVVALGLEDQEPLYRSRTVFPDVPATHWGRGYVNLAVATTVGDSETGSKLMRGMADGTFAPDQNVTYGEAVTVLMRMLGYSDRDAGLQWPQSYLELGAKTGLTKGFTLDGYDVLTRAQAAELLVNLLSCDVKNGQEFYTTLGSYDEDVILLSLDEETYKLTTSGNTVPTRAGIPADLIGKKGVVITDDLGYLAGFIPDGVTKFIVTQTVEARRITDGDGVQYTIAEDVPVYFAKRDTVDYKDGWVDIVSGSALTLYLSENGEVESIYISVGQGSDVMVAPVGARDKPFTPILRGDTPRVIYRDGALASVSDLADYDVGSYDVASGVLTVSSNKLYGAYTAAYPNVKTPTTITVMSMEWELLPQAVDDIAAMKIGDNVTLLLTSEGKVAGVVDGNTLRVDNMGILEEYGEALKVRLLNGLTIEGPTSNYNDTGRGLYHTPGDLVRVNGLPNGKLSVSSSNKSSITGSFNVQAQTVGGYHLTDNCRLFDMVNNSNMVEVELGDIHLSTISGEQVKYMRKTTDNKVDLVIFENVTGDVYQYGKVEEVAGGGVALTNGDHPDGATTVKNTFPFDVNDYVGLATSNHQVRDYVSTAHICTLSHGVVVSRDDFYWYQDGYYLNIDSWNVPVSDNVQCYNEETDTWSTSLVDLRAYADELTVYYDKTPKEGGKIRIVVAEKS